MEIDRKELKRQARQAMHQTKPSFWLVALVYMLMTTGVSLVLNMISFPTNKSGFSTMGLFASVLYGLYAAVIGFGFTLWSLWTARKLDPGINSLTQGFSVSGRVIVMEINIYARIILWSMLASTLVSMIILPVMSYGTMVVGIVAVIGVMVAVSLRYALAPYLLADNPDAGPAMAIRHSVELMNGWKKELFKLEFSFIGWQLLNGVLAAVVILFFLGRAGMFDPAQMTTMQGMMTLYQRVIGSTGVALGTALVTLPLNLWLTPYIHVTRAFFYDARLRHQRDSAPTL